MSGWVTVTFRTELGVARAEIELLRTLYRRDIGWVASGWNRCVHLKYSPYPSDGQVKSLLEETAEYWDKAVVIRANDTGDTGTATLYTQPSPGTVEQTDEFTENQYPDGQFTGKLAAAYMLVEHHVDAISRYEDQVFAHIESEDDINNLY